MANLTYQWTVYGSATLYNNISVNLVGCLFSQDTNANQSVVSFALVSSGSYWRTTNGTASFTGDFTDSQSCATYPNYIYNEDTIFRIEKTITHDANGYKSINVGGIINAYINGANRNATINQINFVIPQIKRQSMWASSLLSISNIENAFTLPINKYVNNYYNVVEVRNQNNSILIKTINDAVDGTSVTFTSSELNTIYAMDNNKYQQDLRFYLDLKTFTNSSKTTQIGTTQRTTCEAYLPNPQPTATYTIAEQDAKVISFLQGDTTKIIKNASDLLFTITATPKYSALISSVQVNGQYATLSSGNYVLNITDLTTGTFNIVVTDSRGYSTTYTASKTLLDYIACKINSWSIQRENPVSSDLVLNANVSVWNGTINGTQNTIVVKYSIDNENWTTIPSSSYTITNNVLTITNLTLEDVIVYTSTATFYLDISDLLSEAKENHQIAKGIPTFSYGENDLQVNGTIYVADTQGENKWSVSNRFNYFDTKTSGYGEICKDISNQNLNTACGTKSGFYRGYNMANAPGNSWWYIIHLAHENDYQKQIAFDYFSNSKYVRTLNNNSWSNWESF